MKVPVTAADVTSRWIGTALKSFPGLNIQDIELQTIGAEYGFGSRIYRCRIVSPQTPLSVVIKLWDTDSPAGLGETLFYQTFGKAPGCRVPICFHAAVDAYQHCGVLVLEDLGGAVQGDCLQRPTLEQ